LSLLARAHLKAVGTLATPNSATLEGATEELSKGILARYAATRARVEAGAALEKVEDLRRVLKELGERLGEAG
jgi:hypothetical protein